MPATQKERLPKGTSSRSYLSVKADLFASSLTPKIVIVGFVHHAAHRWADDGHSARIYGVLNQEAS